MQFVTCKETDFACSFLFVRSNKIKIVPYCCNPREATNGSKTLT